MWRHLTCAVGVVCLYLFSSAWVLAGAPATQPTTRPAPISDNVKKGLDWLSKHQLKDGSWGQGEESSEMGTGMAGIKDTPNVADTCMALMALYTAGSTPTAGEYQHHIVLAVSFICGQVEAADEKSLSITTLTGTRTQLKLGPNIDTFMAAQALAEMKGKMADAADNQRVESVLKKVLRKMEINQKDNGQWAEGGWAPTLAQAQAAKAINLAVQGGEKFDEAKRLKAQQFARADLRSNARSIDGNGHAGAPDTALDSVLMPDNDLGSDFAIASDTKPAKGFTSRSADPATRPTGPATHPAGNAGVPLYSAAADIAAMQASANSNNNSHLRQQAAQIANSPTTSPGHRDEAQHVLYAMTNNDKDLAAAQTAVVNRMQDPQFASGFGSNGGEEYLSYLNIGESLFQKGGNDWIKWAHAMADNLTFIQNADGSWSGGHCITGRTFCTAAAIQVLCIDRSQLAYAPTPPAAQPNAPPTQSGDDIDQQ